MILYPVAQFIELALRDESLKARYGEKARAYLDLIEERVLRKQERYWVQMAPGMGAYRFTESSAERFPNRILPHNQYLALGRVYLVLKDVSGRAAVRRARRPDGRVLQGFPEGNGRRVIPGLTGTG